MQPLKKGQAVTAGRRATIKRRLLEIYQGEPVSLAKAARRAGACRVTVWRWRRDDPDFDQALTEAQKYQDEVRCAVIEDALFERVLSGRCSTGELVFFLCNRSSKRWRHVQTIKAEHSVGSGLSFEKMLLAASSPGGFASLNQQPAQSDASDSDEQGDDLRGRR